MSMSKSAKHEARASLLSGSTLERSNSYSSYPPNAYHSPDSREQDYVAGDGYADGGYGGTLGYPVGGGYVPASAYNRRSGYGSDEPTLGGYFQREGYIAGTTKGSRSSLSDFKYVPTSTWQWAFCAIVFGQAIIGLALECYIFVDFQTSLKSGVSHDTHVKTVPADLALYIFAFIYQLILVYDALRMKNTIQVIGLCLLNIGLLIEAGVQSEQIQEAVDFLQTHNNAIDVDFWRHIQPFIIAVPCVIGLATALMCFVTWKLYHEFAWSIYKDISADLRLMRRYLSYQIYIALLKFDFFFFLAFTVQFLVVVPDTPDFELWITVAAIPITVIILFLAAFWCRRENLWGMVLVILVYFAGLVYFIFKLVRMYWANPNRVLDYLPARKSLTTFAIITVLLLLITIVYAFICTINFNKGLKPHITGAKSRHRAASVEMNKLYGHGEAELVGGGPGLNRITIE